MLCYVHVVSDQENGQQFLQSVMAFSTSDYYLIKTSIVLLLVCQVNTYVNYTLESDKVCSLYRKVGDISVGKDDHSGLIITGKEYFNLSGKHEFSCKFEVKANFEAGLFAVIQKMSFRKDSESGECIDYIQFRHSRRNVITKILPINVDISIKKKDGWGQKHCGKVNAFQEGITDTTDSGNNTRLAPNAFLDEDGRIEVQIVIARMKPDNPLYLELAFTSYKNCFSGDLGSYKVCGQNKCIWKEYFNDGIVNCPFPNCVDEGGCDILYDETDGGKAIPGLRTKVTMAALASIFCSFFFFLSCVWICWYFEVLCWSVGNIRRRANPVEMSPMRSSSFTPTAPPPPSSHDKDLPPSYETLFPDR